MISRTPLSGVTVVVTRPRHQAAELVSALEEAGARALELPLIEIVEPDDGGLALDGALARLSSYEWCVFTSTNTVGRVLERVEAEEFHPVKIAAIGSGTAEALQRGGVHVKLIPPAYVAESLVEVFPEGIGSVLLPRAATARDVLPDGLRRKGWKVDVVTAYNTRELPVAQEDLRLVESADVITFTSPSTVRAFVKAIGRAGLPRIVACIGPITGAAAVEAAIPIDVVADEHSMPGLVRSLSEYFELERRG